MNHTALDPLVRRASLRAGRRLDPGRTITEADVVPVRRVTGNMRRVSTDRHWAAEGRFGERMAHRHARALLRGGAGPFDPERVVALRGIDRVVFRAAGRAGDTISVGGAVRELTDLDPGHGLVATDLRVRNHRGELVAGGS